MNMFALSALVALVPLVTGSIWYNPKVVGRAWIKATGLREEELRKANMPLIFFFCYVFSFLVALGLHSLVIHQMHLYSIVMNAMMNETTKPAAEQAVKSFMDVYGNEFRTFKHGALHGTIAAVMLALPFLGIPALFERKSAKYIFIHLGYWVITLALMGGLICQFSKVG